MLPVRQSIRSALSARQKLCLLLNLKTIRCQEPQSVSSYISPQAAVSGMLFKFCLCTLPGTPVHGSRSFYYNICPTLFLGTLYLICFCSGANLYVCLKKKACQNSVCSHYCLTRQNYRPEIKSAYSGNLLVLVIFILEQFSVGMISAFRSVAMFSTCRDGDIAGNKNLYFVISLVYVFTLDYLAMYSVE